VEVKKNHKYLYNSDDLTLNLIKRTLLKGLIYIEDQVSLILMMGNQNKISGPLLDRIDIQIEVAALSNDDVARQADGESSAAIANRVAHAAQRQLDRQDKYNHALSPNEIDLHCRLDEASEQLLRTAMARLHWSARAYHRVLKIARTIADLEQQASIMQAHVAEAIQYRRALPER
jgi:magnesium chelatase family protein